MSKRIAVIGGGASGMMSAICAARGGADVIICERLARVGKKLLATGNGRCNLTNAGACAENYHGSCARLIPATEKLFWVEQTLAFFEGLGLISKCEENGRIYPYSDQASAVLDVLRFELERLGVGIMTGFEVKSARRTNGGFSITSYGGEVVKADRVIVACGGKASPDLGSNGSGYAILKGLGHTVTELRPSVVQLRTESDKVKPLKGIKAEANVKYMGKECRGEILFTDYGISGPPVFSLSSLYSGGGICIDLIPDYSVSEVAGMIGRAINRGGMCENLFVGILNKRIGMQILKLCGHKMNEECESLDDTEILKLADRAKNFCMKVTGTQSWNNAQVTAGGIPCSEIDTVLMSRKCEGLYITGELLDIDGDCGGYNLQWAWSSGYIAGTAAAH